MIEVVWAIAAVAAIGLFVRGQRVAVRGAKEWIGRRLIDSLEERSRSSAGALGTGLAMGLAAPPSTEASHLALGVVNTALVGPSRAAWIAMGSTSCAAVCGVLVAALSPAPILVAGVILLVFSRVPWPGHTPGDDASGARVGRLLAGWGMVLLAVGLLGYALGGLHGKVRLDSLSLSLGPRLAAIAAACALATAVARSPMLVTCVAILATRSSMLEFSSGLAAGLGALMGLGWPMLRTLLTGTPNARRVAAGAVLYLGGSLAIGTLLVMYSLPWLGGAAAALGDPGLGVALLQVLSLALGAAIWIPVAPPLLLAVDGLFMELENDPAVARHLDGTTISSPLVAHRCAVLEMERMAAVPTKVAGVLREQPPSAFKRAQNDAMVAGLESAISGYARAVVGASAGTNSFEALRALEAMPRAAASTRAVYELLTAYPAGNLPTQTAGDEHLLARMRELQLATLYLIELTDPSRGDLRAASASEQCAAIETHGRALEQWLCQPSLAEARSPESLAGLLDRLVRLSEIAREALEAARDRQRGREPQGLGDENDQQERSAPPLVAA